MHISPPTVQFPLASHRSLAALQARTAWAVAALVLAAGSAAPAAPAPAPPPAAPPAEETRPHAGMLRYPDISRTHIVFAYANDLWTVPRDGGVASPLASPPGPEQFPRFSPDGKTIAFVGNYDGGRDLYTIPIEGGVPTRVTHHPAAETLTDWAPGGTGLIFFSNAIAGLARQTQMFTVPAGGGMPERLPVPYGANGVIDDTGTWLAYTPHTTDTRTWKRYRGGMATDIWISNLKTNEARRITDWEGTDTLPMWRGSRVYYLSDAGPEHRLNIWSVNPLKGGGERKQETRLTAYDIKWPAIGPGTDGKGEIVFQYGPDLMVLDLGTGGTRTVEVTIPGARPTIRPQRVDAAKLIRGWSISPSGRRVAIEARGDVWSAPAEKGSPRNLTHSNGTAERDPAWSPDGRWIAYFSDESGEYELYIRQSDGKGETRRLTRSGEKGAPAAAFRYDPAWSPDSKHIVYTDKTGAILLCTLETGESTLVDTDPWADQAKVSWSHDSRFLAYALGNEDGGGTDDTRVGAIWVYNRETGEKKRVTSGVFADTSPVFDRKGDWLYFVSSRHFHPVYGELDLGFVYPGTQVVLAAPLRADVKSPYLPTSDEEKWSDKKKADQKGDKDKKDEKDGKDGDDAKDPDKKDGDKKEGDKPADGPEKNDDAKRPDRKDDKKDEPKKDEPKKDEPKKDDQPAAPAKDDGVSGSWQATAKGPEPLPPDGMSITISLKLEAGNTVTGSVTALMGSGPIADGRLDPATRDLTFTVALPNNGQATFNLKLAGETMSGTATLGGMIYQIDGKRTAPITATGGRGAGGKDDKESDKPREKVTIDSEGLERRAMILPIKPGNFRHLAVNDKGQLVYARTSAHGIDGAPAIKLFDPKDEKKEEKEIAAGTRDFELTADGKKVLIIRGNAATVQDAAAGGMAKAVPTGGMTTTVDPREEWKQIFTDSWRLNRDFFYVKNMHGVDWPAAREQYGRMLADCATREDVSYVIAEMISELNIGHAYVTGQGDIQDQPSVPVGLLGVDFELDKGGAGVDGKGGAYKIARVVEGAPWDADARGPLGQPGVNVKAGEYLLAVNGVPLDTAKDPWAAFVGQAGRPVTLTVSESPVLSDTAREVVVEPTASETNLRYRAWIECKRQRVEKMTDGRVGYIYVPNTGEDGQNDLVRQFYGQSGKGALIIDERWNGGGQIPNRFIELLNRPATNYWALRDGKDWKWPPDSHQGPKCMLINGLAGSGGDMFPALFKQMKVGKVIGTRTWGGLVGISGNPGLIDGGAITVPRFGYYKLNGTWGIEGHGVDPDITVIDDPSKMQGGTTAAGYDGGDPQLDAAVALMLSELKDHPFVPPTRPADPDRKGMGLPEGDR